MGYSLRNFIIGLVLIILVMFGVVFVVSKLSHKSTSPAVVAKLVHVADFVDKSGSSVTWTQQGRLLGDDRRHAVRVTVTPNERKIELLQGYNQAVSKTATFSNNKTAYTSFLLALENVRFGQERKVKQSDERGVCPLGSRFIYEIHDGSDQKSRLWSDSCLPADGTFAGVGGTVRDLFKAQITDYDKFISGFQL